jgi:hypothetical protein
MALPARSRSASEYLVTRAIHATSWLQGWLEQHLVQQASARAYLRFARAYPRWAQSLFDDYFLTHTAAPLLRRALRPQQHPTAVELAQAWWAQLARPAADGREDQLADVIPVAAAFLAELDAELTVVRAEGAPWGTHAVHPPHHADVC